MDRNNIIGLILIFAIFAGSFYLMKPSEQEIKAEQARQDSTERAKQGLAPVKDSLQTIVASNEVDSAKLNEPFGASSVGSEELIKLENEKIIALVSTKGGRIKSVELKGQQNFDGNPLILFSGEHNSFGLEFNVPGKAVNTNDLYFKSQGANEGSLTMRLNYSDSQYIDYIYSLESDSYNVGLAIETKGIHNTIDVKSKSIFLNWETILTQKEKNISSERDKSSIYYRDVEGNIDHLSESKDDDETVEEKVNWIAFKQHYFSNILSSKEGFDKVELTVRGGTSDSIVKFYKAKTELANTGKDERYNLNFFFGPNQYNTLKAEGHDYNKIINMGWGPISWINRFITVPIFDFLDGFALSYGAVILILTILLKGAMFPLTYKSYLSMAKMRVLKPQLDEIKAKVGEDNPMLLQQEQMKLYKQAGVNPLGGCLPLVLQMPFTLAFFFFFPNLFELRGESFMWVKDLSTYDSPISFAPIIFGIDHISLMCVLMTITTLLTTWYNNTTSGAGAVGQMKYIGYIMPLMFFFLLNNFPAGLNYYYFLAAVFTFLTQVIIRQFIDDEKILAKIEAFKKKPQAEKKTSSFQKRMEDMMRQQQAAQNQKKNK
ncbi:MULTISPECIES: membrane protein insertase YidC [Sphingobacterium]|uniref:Membrane protein insertase YidC n=1 Tax=Sphingobacterium populi TaxID=1812824 RepID=A0ABW5UAN0_9SPHI|nr:membrane protein insertase YidC [Sphingobacterium sp. CFCC 11742]